VFILTPTAIYLQAAAIRLIAGTPINKLWPPTDVIAPIEAWAVAILASLGWRLALAGTGRGSAAVACLMLGASLLELWSVLVAAPGIHLTQYIWFTPIFVGGRITPLGALDSVTNVLAVGLAACAAAMVWRRIALNSDGTLKQW
jgi:hypothetical protein